MALPEDVTRRRAIARMLSVALALVACVGPTFVVQQYAGPQRSAESIAVLRVNGAESVRLLFLDDEDVAAPIPTDGRLHIEMLPARHTVTVADANAGAERFGPVAFRAEAGRVYRIALVAGGEPDGSRAARVFEVDRSKDTVVRDVTLPATVDVPSPPSAPSVSSPDASLEDAATPPSPSSDAGGDDARDE